jgi:hypothetical protein
MADAREGPAENAARKRAFLQRYTVLHRGPDYVEAMHTGRAIFLAGVVGLLLSLGLSVLLGVTGMILESSWLLLLVVVALISEGLVLGGIAVFMEASIGAAEAVQYSLRSFWE